MRQALLIAVTTVAGLGACAPVPSAGYGYAVAPQPVAAYGYYDGGYAPQPYYAEPVYAAPYVTPGYVAPGPAIIIGSERRYNDRYRYERPHYEREGGYRGNPNPGRDYGRQPGPQNFGGGGGGGGRPGPSPASVNRPPPVQTPQPQAPRPSGPGPGPAQGPGPGDHSPSFNPANPTAQGERG